MRIIIMIAITTRTNYNFNLFFKEIKSKKKKLSIEEKVLCKEEIVDLILRLECKPYKRCNKIIKIPLILIFK
jgi:hypothetical protein